MVAKKVVALVLASAVCLTAFSGCGNSASDNSQSTVSSETAGESESAKEENNENITVSMFLQDSADQAISTDLPIIQEITKLHRG